MKVEKGKFSLLKKLSIVILLLGVGIGACTAYIIYNKVYSPNISIETDSCYFYIKTNSTLETVIEQLNTQGNIYVIDNNSLKWVAEKKNYKNHIHPGKYVLRDGMNNNNLINLLRSGKQVTVRLTMNSNIKRKENFISEICAALEADSIELSHLLNDKNFLSNYQLSSENALALFMANTYEFYWNTSAQKFVEKMGKEYKKFWTEERLQKAREIGLSPAQIITLASIVQNETGVDSDKPIIAGVYMNRLHYNMPLQADPTLIWAVGDFSMKRVYNVNKEVESPYNTYKYAGIPPGPICLVDKKSIDAVLNYQKHNYLYFCAKEDFSGYSNFTDSYAQHQLNSKRYQKALDKKGIK